MDNAKYHVMYKRHLNLRLEASKPINSEGQEQQLSEYPQYDYFY